MRIPVPLTLLDDCLVRAIVLVVLAAPLCSSSIFQPGAASDGRATTTGSFPSALLSPTLPLLLRRDAAALELLESPGRNRTDPPGSFFWREFRIPSTVRVRVS